MISIDQPARWNRLLLWATGTYVLIGLGHNIMRASAADSAGLVDLLALALVAVFAVVVVSAGCYGMVKNLPSFGAWGFVIDGRLWVSLALAVLSTLLFAAQRSGGLLSIDASTPFRVSAAFLEETVMRGIFISALLAVAQPKSRWGVAILICFTSGVWALVHIPMHNTSEVANVFVCGILFGYIFYWTRSVLAPVYVHVVANAGMVGGVIAIVAYFAIVGLLRMHARSRQAREVQTI